MSCPVIGLSQTTPLPTATETATVLSTPSGTPAAKGEEIQVIEAETGPPPPPTGITVLTLKEGVYLSWDPAPGGARVTAYNVYRSTVPGSGYRLVNLAPLPSPYFLDGMKTSLDPPKNAENYFYVAAAIGPGGEVSPYSDEIAVTPQGMETPPEKVVPTAVPTVEEERVIAVPERNIVNLQLPADSQLSIQGYKKISATFGSQDYRRPPKPVTNALPINDVEQELVVNLAGKVGKNVDVNVDYSDVNRTGGIDQSKQNISIVYHGNEDSPIEEVTFGDLQLYLPNTEFAGFSKQLFGLQAKVKLDKFHLTTFFAQTKGIAETKIFKGNYVQVDKFIQDIDYTRQKYYLITKESKAVTQFGTAVVFNSKLPVIGTEQIWVEMNTGLANPIDPTQTNYRGTFQRFLPGRDYTIDYNTGVITFIQNIPLSARIAVAFVQRDANKPVGFELGSTTRINLDESTLNLPLGNGPSTLVGTVTDDAHLIKNSDNSVSPLYLVNYFSLGSDKIVPPQQDPDFRFQVIDQGTNDTLQTGQATGVTFTRGFPVPTPPPGQDTWQYQIDQDLNLLIVDNLNNTTYPERAFAGPDGGTGPNGVYNQTQPPTSKKRIHMVYKTKLDFFRLDQFNIIKGSESVYLDGRRLRRDTDYTIDYTSGFLDFPDKSILRPDSQIVVSYEYSPFGTFGQSNILGARAEYDISDRLFVGSTFLMDGGQKPQDTPQLGSTPNNLMLLDADARMDIRSEDIKSVTSMIPGLENWKPPVSLKLSGEVAESTFSTNTFDSEGEKGVAMLDNMEGTDNEVGPNISATNWLVSSPPEAVPAFLPANSYSAAATVNNRVRFYDVAGKIFQTATSILSNIPGTGGHAFQITGAQEDVRSVMVVPYSQLTNQRWGGIRQVISPTGTDISNSSYFETWLYNDDTSKSKWIMFDFGILNEDSNGNNVLDADIGKNPEGNGIKFNQAQPVTNYAIPTFYFQGNHWTPGGDSTLAFDGVLPGEDATQEGRSPIPLFKTEDMNLNATAQLVTIGGVPTTQTTGLDTSQAYYEYGIKANWKGWKLVKIPVNFDAPDGAGTTPDQENISYFFHKQGAPNPQLVRAARMWVTGDSLSEINGYFLLESVGFTRNLWQLQVDPDANVNQGVTTNTSYFDVTSVSSEQDSRYKGSMRFINVAEGQNSSSIQRKEKSLKMTYNLSSANLEPPGIGGKPVYYATRNFGQGMDLTEYDEVRLDLEVRNASPGEVFFLRVGNDQKNYFQYNVQLGNQPRNNWITVTIPLNGSAGNRQQVGTPYINRALLMTLGVFSTNPVPGPTGELWINNLRVTSPEDRIGVARRANAAMILGDNFATINARYREVDSGFAQIDQTSNRFQHSTQFGADYSSSAVKLFSQPLVTQVSVSNQKLYTEDDQRTNPNYFPLPDTDLNSALASISYTKDFGEKFGRLTSLRVSGTSNSELDTYQKAYRDSQTGIQGDTLKTSDNFTLATTYDAPVKLFFLPIGTNQFTQSFTLAYDTQKFLTSDAFEPYERSTRTQVYGWTNTTELVKNLVFTPGYVLSLVDAKGNTNSPGVGGDTDNEYEPFQQRYQPKAGLVYRGIPGVIPSADYSGSNQYDYFSYTDGIRFTNSNNLNLSLNLNPGAWSPFFQKIGLNVFGGRTQSSSATVPGYGKGTLLTRDQAWLMDTPFDPKYGALTANNSETYQLNGGFKLFDVWDFRPTGSWNEQRSLLSQGADPVKQTGRTLALTTIYNKKLLTIPFIAFNFNSAQINYSYTENIQYDSSGEAQIDTRTDSRIYGITLPYDIAQKAQGNIRFQRTVGKQNTRGIESDQLTDTGTVEYFQRFAPNLELHIPFTNWKIKLQDAIEFRTTLLAEFINNTSLANQNNVLKTDRFRGTIDLNYNALKNLRLGLEFVKEEFFNHYTPTLGYSMWQGSISAEARF